MQRDQNDLLMMGKLVLLSALLVLAPKLLCGQELFVCYVKGEPQLSGKSIKVGDKIREDESSTLKFKSRDDFAIVVSATKGRCIISPQQAAASENHLWVLIKDNLVPCKRTNSLYTRSVTDAKDVRDYLYDGRIALADSMKIPLNDDYVSQHKRNYFLITYRTKQDSVVKKFMFNPKSPFIVITKALWESDGQKIESSQAHGMKLLFHDGEWKMDVPLMNLQITSLDDVGIRKSMKLMYDNLNDFFKKDQEAVYHDMTAHILEYYGQINDDSARRYINSIAKSVRK